MDRSPIPSPSRFTTSSTANSRKQSCSPSRTSLRTSRSASIAYDSFEARVGTRVPQIRTHGVVGQRNSFGNTRTTRRNDRAIDAWTLSANRVRPAFEVGDPSSLKLRRCQHARSAFRMVQFAVSYHPVAKKFAPEGLSSIAGGRPASGRAPGKLPNRGHGCRPPAIELGPSGALIRRSAAWRETPLRLCVLPERTPAKLFSTAFHFSLPTR